MRRQTHTVGFLDLLGGDLAVPSAASLSPASTAVPLLHWGRVSSRACCQYCVTGPESGQPNLCPPRTDSLDPTCAPCAPRSVVAAGTHDAPAGRIAWDLDWKLLTGLLCWAQAARRMCCLAPTSRTLCLFPSNSTWEGSDPQGDSPPDATQSPLRP